MDRLERAAISHKWKALDELFCLLESMICMRTVLHDPKITEWEDVEFEKPIKCKGTIPPFFLSLFVSPPPQKNPSSPRHLLKFPAFLRLLMLFSLQIKSLGLHTPDC